MSRYAARTLPPALANQVLRHRELTFWCCATCACMLLAAPEAALAMEVFKAIR